MYRRESLNSEDTKSSTSEMSSQATNITSAPKTSAIDICCQKIADGELEEVKSLISEDPSLLNLMNSSGNSLLLHAVTCGQMDITKYLLSLGMSPNQPGNSGKTPIAIACYQGWYDGLLMLHGHGADPSIADDQSRLPFHASTYDPNIRCLAFLLQSVNQPSIINSSDKEKMTALHWAAYHKRPDHMSLLISKGANIQLVDCDGKTALHWAGQNGSVECINILVHEARGTNLVNMRDNSGKGALHYAAVAGHNEAIKALAETKTLNISLDDPQDRQPLHWAAATGQAECVKTLLELGANPETLDTRAKNPYHYAHDAKHRECMDILKEKLSQLKLARGAVAKSQEVHEVTPIHNHVFAETSDSGSIGIASSTNLDQTTTIRKKNRKSTRNVEVASASPIISASSSIHSEHEELDDVEKLKQPNENHLPKGRKLPPLKGVTNHHPPKGSTSSVENEQTDSANKPQKRREEKRVNKAMKFVPPVSLYTNTDDETENTEL